MFWIFSGCFETFAHLPIKFLFNDQAKRKVLMNTIDQGEKISQKFLHSMCGIVIQQTTSDLQTKLPMRKFISVCEKR